MKDFFTKHSQPYCAMISTLYDRQIIQLISYYIFLYISFNSAIYFCWKYSQLESLYFYYCLYSNRSAVLTICHKTYDLYIVIPGSKNMWLQKKHYEIGKLPLKNENQPCHPLLTCMFKCNRLENIYWYLVTSIYLYAKKKDSEKSYIYIVPTGNMFVCFFFDQGFFKQYFSC